MTVPIPTREASAQNAPDQRLNRTFPKSHLTPARTLYRAHHADNGPGWFASTGGRFDLPDPHGTLYAADDTETALRERFGAVFAQSGVITHATAAETTVTALPGILGQYANIGHAAAARFGVLRELSTMTSYTIPQRWAHAFHQLGLKGVRYPSRFTTAPGPNAWAIFGEHGAHTIPTGEQIGGIAACRAAGLLVAAPRSRKGLTVIDPPVIEGPTVT